MSEFGDHFATTRWTVVLQAASTEHEERREALEELCKAYWQPLYSFVRRKGHSPQEASDLTQGFFVHLLEKKVLEKTAPHRGKFRSFLLACAQNFLSNEYDRQNALKRGGGMGRISLDMAEAESRFSLVSDEKNPELAFDKQWANALLARVHDRLLASAKSSRIDFQKAMMPFLTADPDELTYDELATQFSMTKVATRVAVFRLRERFRAILRDEVAETIQLGDSIEDEISHLLNVLKS